MYVAICPLCKSRRVCRAGTRRTKHGDVQRYLCRDCGFRFSEGGKQGAKPFYTPSSEGSTCQVGAPPNAHGRVKNLVTVEPLRDGLAGATIDAKGKVIDYSFWLLKQGYAESTITSHTKLLKILIKRGANLYDPESVKETIALQEWSAGRKSNAVDTYTCFLRMQGITWNPPHYRRIRKHPFIPSETEIDQLIAGCGKKTATLLQLLKETGMRVGEAWRLHWTDIDFTQHTVRVTPEKGSNPRVLKLSSKLLSMLQTLQPHSTRKKVFAKSLKSQRRLFNKQRKRIAAKLQNPRIADISFHTLRHWKATMEYHRTKDILHVMKLLGHRNINNTLTYTQLVDLADEEFVSKVAKTVDEACALVEAGFDYVTDIDDVKIFRKRK